MELVYSPEIPSSSFTKSIFLAGPSPRHPSHLNWRIEAIKILEEIGYDGVVFLPLPRAGGWSHSYDFQVEWENTYMQMADQIVFWVPREMSTLPGFITNVEFGMWYKSGKIVLGYPIEAQKMRYLVHHAQEQFVPISNSLKETLELAIGRLGEGAYRTLGEREVPLYIWQTESFQNWYKAQKEVGNRLDGAKVVWTFRVGPTQDFVFFWALHVNMYIDSENRNKTNEVVISRPDIATIVVYKKAEQLLDTLIVLIKEFRVSASTSDGFIRELPGGSSWKLNEDSFVIATHELAEETGFFVDASRLRLVGERQIIGTAFTHKAHVFACEINDQEIEFFKAQFGIIHGVAEDTEHTYVEIHRLGDLLKPDSNLVDWSMLGMIMTALSQ